MKLKIANDEDCLEHYNLEMVYDMPEQGVQSALWESSRDSLV